MQLSKCLEARINSLKKTARKQKTERNDTQLSLWLVFKRFFHHATSSHADCGGLASAATCPDARLIVNVWHIYVNGPKCSSHSLLRKLTTTPKICLHATLGRQSRR